MTSLFDLLKDAIPNDHSRQVSSTHYGEEFAANGPSGALVLDLGCGAGASRRIFRARRDMSWVGVDLQSSPEVDARNRLDGRVVTYDGVRLPFRDESFDCVYSTQVLEHVRYPRAVLREVSRVLKPGAVFVGSTSNLEPYHTLSLWSYTPYGFKVLVAEAGLQLEELRPGIDGITLTKRSYLGRPAEYSRFFAEESPLNQEITAWGADTGRRPALVNNRKLQYCGQFAFRTRKPTNASDSEPPAPRNS